MLEYIAAGDVFQVNLSQRFTSRGTFDPLDLYLRLRDRSPAPFAAFLRWDDLAVVSASPEWFYQTRGDRIVTRPIKGTRPRGESEEADARLAAELAASPKDRAELTMIVNLERNDLGRVCRYGSVVVKDALQVESFAQVHHLVATVEGRLWPDAGPVDIVRAMFPGGSITGAPRSAPWRSSTSWSRTAAASTRAPSAISAGGARAASTSRSGPSWWKAIVPATRSAAGSSPTPTRRRNTRRPSPRAAPCARSSRGRGGHRAMIWTGGEIIPDEALRVSVLDRTFEHGLGLFETFRTWNGHATLLGRHRERMCRSAAALGLRLSSARLAGRIGGPSIASGKRPLRQ